jgi:hypothetical protein
MNTITGNDKYIIYNIDLRIVITIMMKDLRTIILIFLKTRSLVEQSLNTNIFHKILTKTMMIFGTNPIATKQVRI